MGTDYIELGSSPVEEPCFQVGGASDIQLKKEAQLYKKLLETLYQNATPVLEENMWFSIKYCSHDFGGYYEVRAVYEELSEEARELAVEIEGNSPNFWPASFKEVWEKIRKDESYDIREFLSSTPTIEESARE